MTLEFKHCLKHSAARYAIMAVNHGVSKPLIIRAIMYLMGRVDRDVITAEFVESELRLLLHDYGASWFLHFDETHSFAAGRRPEAEQIAREIFPEIFKEEAIHDGQ